MQNGGWNSQWSQLFRSCRARRANPAFALQEERLTHGEKSRRFAEAHTPANRIGLSGGRFITENFSLSLSGPKPDDLWTGNAKPFSKVMAALQVVQSVA